METTFRAYGAEARSGVTEFYRLNHLHQTHEFVGQQKKRYLSLDRCEMGIWEALEFLDTLVDDSDPDTELSQLEHAFQSAEAARSDNRPDWFVLTCLIHDLGKILCSYGEPQWAVVGDTFPVGCRFSDRIIYHELFEGNPDLDRVDFQSEEGIYRPGVGLSAVQMSWGHDEYLFHVVKDHLPLPALYMIRYHSFYPWHQQGAYQHLTDDTDQRMLPWVKAFNPYDLYSKADEPPDIDGLRDDYHSLIRRFFPEKIRW